MADEGRFCVSNGRVKCFVLSTFFHATELSMGTDRGTLRLYSPATSFFDMGNLAAGFEHRPKGKLHLQYRPAVVPPLAERRSDTWMIFELAKRVGLGREFWEGDTEAAYEHGIARGFNTPDKKVEIYSHTFAAHGFSPLPEMWNL